MQDAVRGPTTPARPAPKTRLRKPGPQPQAVERVENPLTASHIETIPDNNEQEKEMKDLIKTDAAFLEVETSATLSYFRVYLVGGDTQGWIAIPPRFLTSRVYPIPLSTGEYIDKVQYKRTAGTATIISMLAKRARAISQ